ncbi:MAG: hypothetical protein WHS82_00580 [Candidatus Methanosuratincola sp.]
MRMIVLLSGKGKFEVSDSVKDEVLLAGESLFRALEEGKDEEFREKLAQLHSFILEKGVHAELIRHADLAVPPVDSDPGLLRRVLGIDQTKKGTY